MAVDARAQRVILGYSDAFLAVRQRLRTYTRFQWDNLGDYRDDDIARFARAMDRAVTGSQLQVARLTDQYLAVIGGLIVGAALRPVGISPSLVTDLAMRGVPATEVYARTGPEVYYALSQGATPPDAFAQGLDRALSAASTDLQLAKTHTSREVAANSDGIIGYQRVPEGDKPCELCLIWADKVQATDELMAIHDNCSCDMVPLYADGRNVDASALRDNAPLDPEQERGTPAVQEHPELGPVLVVDGSPLFVPRSERNLRSDAGEF